MNILQWNGDILAIPDYKHATQVEVYEHITGILLGLLDIANPQHLSREIIRIPLLKTMHYGTTFENEDRFEGEAVPIGQFVDLKVENFFFNGGKSKKRVIWCDYGSWKKLIEDREINL
jgi:hypothetical protein